MRSALNTEVLRAILAANQITVCGKCGTVRRAGKRVYTEPNLCGYLRFRVWYKDRRHWIFVHKAVWISLHGVPHYSKVIDHIDEDKQNNASENLQLLTQGENVRKAARIRRGKTIGAF